jgi:hypothetical protein
MQNDFDRFNLLATKDDLLKMKDEITQELGKKMDSILNVVDGIAKKHEDHEIEHVANLSAHIRMQEDINEIRKHIGIKIKNPVVK